MNCWSVVSGTLDEVVRGYGKVIVDCKSEAEARYVMSVLNDRSKGTTEYFIQGWNNTTGIWL